MAQQFDLTAQINLQAPRNTKAVVNDIRRQLKGIDIDLNVKNMRSIGSANKEMQSFNRAAKNTNRSVGDLNRTLQESARRFSVITIATGSLLALANSFKNSVKSAIEFERELIKISQVTGKSVSNLQGLTKEITRLSTSFGASSSDLLSVTKILSQAGFEAGETRKALDILAKTSLGSTFDNIQDTTEGAIAVLRQFTAEAQKAGGNIKFLEQTLDAVNSVSKSFAVESGDLITAIRRVGGVFSAAGGSVNELIALFTSVRSTTRESAETIATGLRTIFTRIQRTDTIDSLKKLNIELSDSQGNFVGAFKAVERLSKGLSGLDPRSGTFSQIVEELGGFRQVGKVIPLIQQFTTAQNALNVAQGASGSVGRDAIKAQQGLGVQIQKVREQFDALIRKFADSSTFNTIAGGALKLAEAFIKIADALEPLLPLIAGLSFAKLGKSLAPAIGGVFGVGRRANMPQNVSKFNRGGMVPGTGNSDTVPAMLTPGEFVIRKSSVKKLGADRLNQMNNNRYAKAGVVKAGSKGGGVNKKDKQPENPLESWQESQKTQLAHIGSQQPLTNSQIKNLLENIGSGRAKGAALSNTVKGVLGTKSLSNLSSKQISEVKKRIEPFSIMPLLMSIPAKTNQALKGTGEGSIKSGLASWITQNPSALTKKGRRSSVSINAKDIASGNLNNFANSVGSAVFSLPKKIIKDFDVQNIKDDIFELLTPEKQSKILGVRDILFRTPGQKRSQGRLESKPKNILRNLALGGLIQQFGIGGDVVSTVGKTKGKTLEQALQMFPRPNRNALNAAFGKDVVDAYYGGDAAQTQAASRKAEGEARKKKGAVDSNLAYGAAFLQKVTNAQSGERSVQVDGKKVLYDLKTAYVDAADANKIKEEYVVPQAMKAVNSIAGLFANSVGSKASKSNNIPNLPAITGSLYEAGLARVVGGIQDDADDSRLFDFAGGLKDAAGVFGADGKALQNIKTDAKVTSSSSAIKSIRAKIKNDLAKNKFAKGGAAPSDTVPALLTPGEFVFSADSAKKIGYSNLNRMNKQGVQGYAAGGVVQRFSTGTSGRGVKKNQQREEAAYRASRSATINPGNQAASDAQNYSSMNPVDPALSVAMETLTQVMNGEISAVSNLTEARAMVEKAAEEEEKEVYKNIRATEKDTSASEALKRARNLVRNKYGKLLPAESKAVNVASKLNQQREQLLAKEKQQLQQTIDKETGRGKRTEGAVNKLQQAQGVTQSAQSFVFLAGTVSAVATQFTDLEETTKKTVTQMVGFYTNMIGVVGTVADVAISLGLMAAQSRMNAAEAARNAAVSKLEAIAKAENVAATKASIVAEGAETVGNYAAVKAEGAETLTNVAAAASENAETVTNIKAAAVNGLTSVVGMITSPLALLAAGVTALAGVFLYMDFVTTELKNLAAASKEAADNARQRFESGEDKNSGRRDAEKQFELLAKSTAAEDKTSLLASEATWATIGGIAGGALLGAISGGTLTGVGIAAGAAIGAGYASDGFTKMEEIDKRIEQEDRLSAELERQLKVLGDLYNSYESLVNSSVSLDKSLLRIEQNEFLTDFQKASRRSSALATADTAGGAKRQIETSMEVLRSRLLGSGQSISAARDGKIEVNDKTSAFDKSLIEKATKDLDLALSTVTKSLLESRKTLSLARSEALKDEQFLGADKIGGIVSGLVKPTSLYGKSLQQTAELIKQESAVRLASLNLQKAEAQFKLNALKIDLINDKGNQQLIDQVKLQENLIEALNGSIKQETKQRDASLTSLAETSATAEIVRGTEIDSIRATAKAQLDYASTLRGIQSDLLAFTTFADNIERASADFDAFSTTRGGGLVSGVTVKLTETDLAKIQNPKRFAREASAIANSVVNPIMRERATRATQNIFARQDKVTQAQGLLARPNAFVGSNANNQVANILKSIGLDKDLTSGQFGEIVQNIVDQSKDGLSFDEISAIFSDFTSASEAELKILQQVVRANEGYLDLHKKRLSELLQVQDEEINARQKLVESQEAASDIRDRAAQSLAESMGFDAPRASQARQRASREVSLARANLLTRRVNPNLVGDSPALAALAESLKSRIEEATRSLRDPSRTPRQQAQTMTELARMQGALRGVTDELDRLSTSTSMADAMFEEMDKNKEAIDRERSKRQTLLNVLEEAVTGGIEGRRDLARRGAMSERAIAMGTLQGFKPEQQQEIVSFLRGLGNEIKIGRTGKSGKELADILISRDIMRDRFIPPVFKQALMNTMTSEQALLNSQQKLKNSIDFLAGRMNQAGQAQFQVQARSSGGVIYRQNGGPISRGTDTVPAMLTPGEFVMSKPAVDRIGVGTLSRINSGKSSVPKGLRRGGVLYADGGAFVDSVKGSGFDPQESMIESMREFMISKSSGSRQDIAKIDKYFESFRRSGDPGVLGGRGNIRRLLSAKNREGFQGTNAQIYGDTLRLIMNEFVDTVGFVDFTGLSTAAAGALHVGLDAVGAGALDSAEDPLRKKLAVGTGLAVFGGSSINAIRKTATRGTEKAMEKTVSAAAAANTPKQTTKQTTKQAYLASLEASENIAREAGQELDNRLFKFSADQLKDVGGEAYSFVRLPKTGRVKGAPVTGSLDDMSGLGTPLRIPQETSRAERMAIESLKATGDYVDAGTGLSKGGRFMQFNSQLKGQSKEYIYKQIEKAHRAAGTPQDEINAVLANAQKHRMTAISELYKAQGNLVSKGSGLEKISVSSLGKVDDSLMGLESFVARSGRNAPLEFLGNPIGSGELKLADDLFTVGDVARGTGIGKTTSNLVSNSVNSATGYPKRIQEFFNKLSSKETTEAILPAAEKKTLDKIRKSLSGNRDYNFKKQYYKMIAEGVEPAEALRLSKSVLGSSKQPISKAATKSSKLGVSSFRAANEMAPIIKDFFPALAKTMYEGYEEGSISRGAIPYVRTAESLIKNAYNDYDNTTGIIKSFEDLANLRLPSGSGGVLGDLSSPSFKEAIPGLSETMAEARKMAQQQIERADFDKENPDLAAIPKATGKQTSGRNDNRSFVGSVLNNAPFVGSMGLGNLYDNMMGNLGNNYMRNYDYFTRDLNANPNEELLRRIKVSHDDITLKNSLAQLYFKQHLDKKKAERDEKAAERELELAEEYAKRNASGLEFEKQQRNKRKLADEQNVYNKENLLDISTPPGKRLHDYADLLRQKVMDGGLGGEPLKVSGSDASFMVSAYENKEFPMFDLIGNSVNSTDQTKSYKTIMGITNLNDIEDYLRENIGKEIDSKPSLTEGAVPFVQEAILGQEKSVSSKVFNSRQIKDIKTWSKKQHGGASYALVQGLYDDYFSTENKDRFGAPRGYADWINRYYGVYNGFSKKDDSVYFHMLDQSRNSKRFEYDTSDGNPNDLFGNPAFFLAKNRYRAFGNDSNAAFNDYPRFATGGTVPSSAAQTGMGMGTDTVPAMLTPGEFVIRKSSVDKYGTSFMNSLNSGTVQGLFRGGKAKRGRAAEAGVGAVGIAPLINKLQLTWTPLIIDTKNNMEALNVSVQGLIGINREFLNVYEQIKTIGENISDAAKEIAIAHRNLEQAWKTPLKIEATHFHSIEGMVYIAESGRIAEEIGDALGDIIKTELEEDLPSFIQNLLNNNP